MPANLMLELYSMPLCDANQLASLAVQKTVDTMTWVTKKNVLTLNRSYSEKSL